MLNSLFSAITAGNISVVVPPGFSTGGSNPVFNLISFTITLLIFLGIATALIVVIVAGIKRMASNGDKKAEASAQGTLRYALIGLVCLLLVYVPVRFIGVLYGVDLIGGQGLSSPPQCTPSCSSYQSVGAGGSCSNGCGGFCNNACGSGLLCSVSLATCMPSNVSCNLAVRCNALARSGNVGDSCTMYFAANDTTCGGIAPQPCANMCASFNCIGNSSGVGDPYVCSVDFPQ